MKNLDKINEIKRNEVVAMLSIPEIVKYFDSIKIFGSAITDRCREDSDIDMYVTLKPEYVQEDIVESTWRLLMRASKSDKDIIYAHEMTDHINNSLFNAMQNGIEVLKD